MKPFKRNRIKNGGKRSCKFCTQGKLLSKYFKKNTLEKIQRVVKGKL